MKKEGSPVPNRRNIRRVCAALLLWLLLECPLAAYCEGLTLPSSLSVIEEEAFAGNSSLTAAVLPDTVREIGPRAFAGCVNLLSIRIPAATEIIAPDALDGIPGPLLISAPPGSAAMRFALNNGLDFQADTVYRALIIANAGYTDLAELPGTLTDAESVSAMLASFPGTDYSVTVCRDQTAEGILSCIRGVFAGAQAQDVSLLYYSGHGKRSSDASVNGALVGIDGSLVTAAALRACLDELPGRKIVIADACYSGGLIGRSADAAANAGDAFVSGFISEFVGSGAALRGRSGDNLADNGYYVMAAAHSSEESYEYTDRINGVSVCYGIFSWALCLGCGYDLVKQAYTSAAADQDGNGVISIQEAYAEALRNVLKTGAAQSAQVWPAQCVRFGFLRK